MHSIRDSRNSTGGGRFVEYSDGGVLEVQSLITRLYTDRGTVRAVEAVDVSIREGTTVGVVGESGSGKSMLALSIMRLVPSPPGRIEGGSVLYRGRDLLKLSGSEMRRVRGQEIAMIFQDPSSFLNPVLAVGKQMGEALHLRGESNVKARTMEALDLVQLPRASEVWRRYPHELSGGMRQRVMIAMAIMLRPKLLIADEPTTALDVTVQLQILDLLRQIQDEYKMALLLITHDLGVVADMCDRVYVMYAGQVVEVADALTLFDMPKHPYSHGLLESIVSIESTRARLPTIQGAVPDLTQLSAGCSFAPRCQYADRRCVEEAPPNVRLSESHSVRCWLLSEAISSNGDGRDGS